MNDLLKILSKTIKPYGYHVRPTTGLNFLRVPALEKLEENHENVVLARKMTDHAVVPALSGNLGKMVIFLRTCLRENRNVNTRPRITGDQHENAYRCIWSLVKSINYAASCNLGIQFRLIVLDDRSDESARKKIAAIVNKVHADLEMKTTSYAGQGGSLHQQFSEARHEDALVYCVEDDYLHEETGIIRLWQFYNDMASKTGQHMVLYPQEHNELYSNHYPSYIVAGSDCHWRSMRHATHTFLTHGTVINKYWDYFENTKYVGNKKKRKKGSEARTTNQLFQKIPGFSPLYPCAVHLQYEELLPPYYDWQPLWAANVPPFA